MLKQIIFATTLAIFAFAQNANAQKKAEVKTLGDLISYNIADLQKTTTQKPKQETTTLGEISALAELKSTSAPATCEITSLVLQIERAGLDPMEITGLTNKEKFSKTMKSLKKGDRLTFTQMKGKCKGEAKEQELTDVVIEVK